VGPRHRTARPMPAEIKRRAEIGPKEVGVRTKVKSVGSPAQVIEVQAVPETAGETAARRAPEIVGEIAARRAPEIVGEIAARRAPEIAPAIEEDPPLEAQAAKALLSAVVRAAGAATQREPAAREGVQAWEVAVADLVVAAVVVGGGGNRS